MRKWLMVIVNSFALFASAQSDAPELVLPSGHLEEINCTAWSPDGKFIITGSSDLTIHSWEAATGREIRTYRGAASRIRVVKFSPDGTSFVAGCEDGKILRWDLVSGTLLNVMNVHTAAVLCIDFFSNTQFLSGGMDKAARVWDISENRATTTVYEKQYTIHSVAWYPGGNFFLTGGGDHPETKGTTEQTDFPVKLWNVNGTQAKMFKAGWLDIAEDANIAGFSPDGQFVFAGYLFGGRVFDVSKESKPTDKVKGYIKFGCMGPGAKTVLVANQKDIDLFEFPSGKKIRSYERLPKDITSVCFSPDGNSIVYSTVSKTAVVMDVLSGEIKTRLIARSGGVLSVVFSPYGKFLATGGIDATVKIWDIETGVLVDVLKDQKYPVRCLAFSPDNKKIVAGCLENTGTLYDIATGKALYSFKGGSGSVIFSPDGKHLLALDRTIENKFYMYETETGKLEKEFSRPGIKIAKSRVNICGVFSPDGKTIYIGGTEDHPVEGQDGHWASYGEIQVYDVPSGKFVKQLADRQNPIITCMDISSDGQTLVTGSSGNTICFWNRVLGVKTSGYEIHKDVVMSVNFSPDNKTVLTSSLDGTAKIIDSKSASTIIVLRGHTAALWGARFSPDGKYVVTVSWDNTTRLWNAASGVELARLTPVDTDQWLAVTPDGYFDGSEKALHTLYYTYKEHVFPLEQLKPKYYRKKLVPILLGYEQGELRGTGPFLASSCYPEVIINNTVNPRNPVVTVQLKDLGGGIGAVHVKINGTEAYEDIRTLVKDKKELTGGNVRIAVPLAASKLMKWGSSNTIEVVAYNAENSLSTPPVSIRIDTPKQIK